VRRKVTGRHSGSVSGLGKRAGGEEEDEELSRNAGGQTRKVLPFFFFNNWIYTIKGVFGMALLHPRAALL
jgi:hypothetical protein